MGGGGGGVNEDPFLVHKSIDNEGYEKICSAEDDVVLFYKTQGLYYVKTDNLFRSIKIKFDLFTFDFDATTLENKQATTKKELHFSLVGVVKEEIKIKVSWQEGNKKTDAKGIAKKLKQYNIKASEEEVEKAFRYFKQQTKCDFFINKNAKAFLQEQFKIWCANYLWDNDGHWSAERVNEIQGLKDIAFKLIYFFSQFEDELVSIWNKPKFARNSNYVISIDRVDEKVLKKIKAHRGYKEQLEEWDNLGINKDSATAPIDTKFFKDLELEILSNFECLDEALDGRLIKSENYQALNTIMHKFQEKVQCIYIDPPFNLGANGDFDYEVNYKDASWASLLENRVGLSKSLLQETGSMYVRCDYNGNWILRPLLNKIFGPNNFKNEIILSKSIRIKTEGKKFPSWHDTLFYYAQNINAASFNHIKEARKEEAWRSLDTEGENWSVIPDNLVDKISPENIKYNEQKQPISRARVFLGQEILPREGRRFPKQEYISQLEEEGKIRISGKGNPQMKKPADIYLTDDWTDILSYSNLTSFSTENSEHLLRRAIETATKTSELVMDFFLGSGTTTAVSHKMGRKWIGVEMGEHFDTVVLPRMKKVLAYDKTGISKKVPEYKGGGFFKYYELEQYEEVLAKCQMAEMGDDLITHTNKSDYEQYVFLTNTKLTGCVEVDLKKKKYKIDLSKLYDNIDVAETISNKSGRWIKSISKDKVEFTDGHSIDLKNLDYKEIKELIWWERPKR